ncbi:MAG: hypothetical protein LBL31_03345 [Spirochaetaceae bacterium]|jgi:hypothetical protein|nr:hypothetical protein [Spirochaetaceae bacterium]
MKKAIALVMILALTAATLFAAPVSVVGSVDTPSAEVTLVGLSAQTNISNDFDDLFAGVHAARLTDIEANNVEGEGVGLGLALGTVLGTIGAGVGAIYGFFSNFQYGPAATFSGMATSALLGGGGGFGLGFLIGLCF